MTANNCPKPPATELQIDPPVHGIKAMTGLGKTTFVLKILPQFLAEKQEGQAIYISVPTHLLADELAEKIRERFPDHPMRILTYRGLTADDPEQVGLKMCRISEDANDLRQGGADIRYLCGTKRDGEDILCPHYHECGYKRQQRMADIVIMPQNLLAFARPSFLYPACVLINDEFPVPALLTGLDGPARSVTLYDIRSSRTVPVSEGLYRTDKDATRFLEGVKSKIASAIEKVEPGKPIPLSAITNTGLTSSEILEARDFTLRCKKKITLTPDMTAGERQLEVTVAKDNKRLLMEVRFWGLIARALESKSKIIPGLRLEVDEKAEKRFLSVRLRWREEIHECWQVPTLLLDATANWDLYRPFWPNIDRTYEFDAATPHINIKQILWSAAKAKLLGKTETQQNNRSRIFKYIEARSTEFKSVLVICQKGLEEELARTSLPDNVVTGHFNGMRGIDKFGNVECLIVIGRPQPQPDHAEMFAELVFDEETVRGPEWDGSYYPNIKVGLNFQGENSGPAVKMEYHTDPNVEAARRSICEAELIQAIGRGRAVNRTAETPLQIDIIGTVPLPINVDEVVEWNGAQADPFSLMKARGILPNCDSSKRGYWNLVAAILYDRFLNPQAAKDWGRSVTVESTNRNILISESHREGYIEAEIRLAGTRYKVPVLIRPGEVDPKMFVVSIVGPLSHFEFASSTPAINEQGNDPFVADFVTGNSGPVYIDPPFTPTPPVPPPANPQQPALVNTEPDAKADDFFQTAETPEQSWRLVVNGMDPLDWLDDEAANLEATRLWMSRRAVINQSRK